MLGFLHVQLEGKPFRQKVNSEGKKRWSSSLHFYDSSILIKELTQYASCYIS